MKKLTAGIFATILGVTAMGAADAAVTSKGYVDAAVGAVAQSVTDLGTTVSSTYATKQALETAQSTLQGNIDTVSAVANAAAPQATTYTKDEVDAKVASVDGAAAISGLEGEIATIKQEQVTQNTNITNLQNDKANAADVYTKTEADAAFATAAQGVLAGTAVQPGDLADVATSGAYADLTGTPDLSDMATNTGVASTYATKTDVNTALASKVDTTTLNNYATKTDAQGYANAKDAAISAAQTAADNAAAAAGVADGKAVAAQAAAEAAQAAADAAQGDATQALTDAGNAQTAADAANAALNTANKLSDGQYALTMKVVDGVTSYGWELIDRDYVSTDTTPNGQ